MMIKLTQILLGVILILISTAYSIPAIIDISSGQSFLYLQDELNGRYYSDPVWLNGLYHGENPAPMVPIGLKIKYIFEFLLSLEASFLAIFLIVFLLNTFNIFPKSRNFIKTGLILLLVIILAQVLFIIVREWGWYFWTGGFNGLIAGFLWVLLFLFLLSISIYKRESSLP